jgi:hypothetical protein
MSCTIEQHQGFQRPPSIAEAHDDAARLLLNRVFRGLAFACLIGLFIAPASLLALRWLAPHAAQLQSVVFWAWLFLSPLLAGTGLLLTMLAIVVVNPRYRIAAILLGTLTATFLVLISQSV